jgi:hypothetical protein
VLTKIGRIVEPNFPCCEHGVKRLGCFSQIVLSVVVFLDTQTRAAEMFGRFSPVIWFNKSLEPHERLVIRDDRQIFENLKNKIFVCDPPGERRERGFAIFKCRGVGWLLSARVLVLRNANPQK